MSATAPANRQRAPRQGSLRDAALVFCLSLLNLIAIVLLVGAVRGLGDWSTWQFAGLYGLIDAGVGLADLWAPNLWQLSVAALESDRRVELDLSKLGAMRLGGFGRITAGCVLIVLAATKEGVEPATVAVVPAVVLIALFALGLSALVARLAVARPELDVLRISLEWRRRTWAPAPISLTAALLQLSMTIAPVLAMVLLRPSVLYRPALVPSLEALLLLFVATLVSASLAYVAWRSRLASG